MKEKIINFIIELMAAFTVAILMKFILHLSYKTAFIIAMVIFAITYIGVYIALPLSGKFVTLIVKMIFGK